MKKFIEEIIKKAVVDLGFEKEIDFVVDAPPSPDLGDFATNVAFLIGGNPRENAEKIAEKLKGQEEIEKVEIAGPGFINIFLKKDIYEKEVKKILAEGKDYGKSNVGNGKKVNVEFVSANPTGPLHIGNARSGPIGETIANLYKFNGFDVVREFYVNDVGVQIGRFGNSLYHWYAIKEDSSLEFPKDGYPAEYIKETSEEIQEKFSEEINSATEIEKKKALFAREGLILMVDKIKKDLQLVGIEIDQWSYESEIFKSGKSENIINSLEKKGLTAEKDGALWFENPDDKDLLDKEAVLRKSDAEKSLTYFANDIAYHLDKIARGADKLIDIWGSNHFGHIPRMKAALKTLGYDDLLDIILYQYVRLKSGGRAMSMGKRLGNFVTLRQVIEGGVEPDAFKYFILSQNMNTPMEFDIELASDRSEKNPVYYIKYAHARICSILEKAGDVDIADADLSKLHDPKEILLMKELCNFGDIIKKASEDYEIQALPHYANKIAKLFHDFYGSCRIIGEESEIFKARIALIITTKTILKSTLNLCGIEAPKKM